MKFLGVTVIDNENYVNIFLSGQSSVEIDVLPGAFYLIYFI